MLEQELVVSMDKCRLRLLGPPQIVQDGKASSVRLRKVVALLAYLAIEQRPFLREHLAALLWPDACQERALANLRRTLSHLRTTLQDGCVVTDGDQIVLDPGSVVVDVVEFHELTQQPPGEDMERLLAAAELYRGDFLEGFNLGDCEEFDEWQDAVRERLRLQFDDVVANLSKGYLEAGQPELAIEYAHRWLELDQLNECAHRILMKAYLAAGRADLARHQYESCRSILEREGIEPDELTVALHDEIERGGKKDPAGEVAERTTRVQAGVRRRRNWIWWAVAAALAVGIISGAVKTLPLLIKHDLSFTDMEVRQSRGVLSAIRMEVRNQGGPLRAVNYSLVFQADQHFVAPREYVVYADSIRIGRNSEANLNVNAQSDIVEYIHENGVDIPPGNYSAELRLDPFEKIADRSRFDNLISDPELFFFPGSDPALAIGVEISYDGEDPLDPQNPLKLLIGDLALNNQGFVCAVFSVTREGTCYLPVADLTCPDKDGSGYFMAIIHDIGNDSFEDLFRTEPDDIKALYREGGGNLVYGEFSPGLGSPLYPGNTYRVHFAKPPVPGPDEFEVDDWLELGTVVDYADLPVSQFHTFHDEGTGDIDYDWVQIFLRNGESLTVETHSAGGLWETETQIDFNSSSDYITSSGNKSMNDRYSLLRYVNDTGIDQTFYFVVKPTNQATTLVYPNGEYILELRK